MRYKVDLKHYMAECDTNYARLIQLFPRMGEESECRIALGGGHLHMRVKSRMTYTTDLEILCSEGYDSLDWYGAATLKVRLYHDVRSAEVYEFGTARQPAPKNQYPNRHMYHRDERVQWNTFLKDWLAHARTHGLSDEPVFG
ncbi:MAG: DUF1249 domain-containing protein [bacterium]